MLNYSEIVLYCGGTSCIPELKCYYEQGSDIFQPSLSSTLNVICTNITVTIASHSRSTATSKLSTHGMWLKTHLLEMSSQDEIDPLFFPLQAPDTHFTKILSARALCQFTDTTININLQNSFADIVDGGQSTLLKHTQPSLPQCSLSGVALQTGCCDFMLVYPILYGYPLCLSGAVTVLCPWAIFAMHQLCCNYLHCTLINGSKQ